ncbi:MAG: hypothetical protein ACUVQZ_01150 [Candidatus Caldatribacteriaceae bacterium]
MKCDLCHRNEAVVAVYFANRKEGISKSKLLICQECAERLSMAKILETRKIMVGSSPKSKEAYPKISEKQCSFCGFSWSDFQKRGFVGCSNCYAYFEGEFSGEIARTQRGTLHRGKIPKRWSKEQKIKQDISKIMAEFQKCVEEENYERAEHFKRLINRLRSRLE